MPMLGSANRQEDRYPDPNNFDIFRQAKGNLGWGHGVHVCLGMHLARLEMRTAINLLLDRLPNLRLDPDGDDPHTVFVDHLLMSPGTEDYKQAPSADCVEQVRRFLDAQLVASRVV